MSLCSSGMLSRRFGVRVDSLWDLTGGQGGEIPLAGEEYEVGILIGV